MPRVDPGRKRCAIYTRKSSEEGLEQEFNSLQAQREACEAFINSQRHEGWVCLPQAYDDGGFSGATMDRPALQQLLADITAGWHQLTFGQVVDSPAGGGWVESCPSRWRARGGARRSWCCGTPAAPCGPRAAAGGRRGARP